MQAIKELYKIGRGPSSSHTLAPERACKLFVQEFGEAPYYEVELFGSLSLTGKGHHTDSIIIETLPGETHVKFSLNWEEEFPNGFYLCSYDENHNFLHKWTVFSIGGGSIQIKEKPVNWNDELYVEKSFKEVLKVISDKKITLLDYIYGYEPDLREYLDTILEAMDQCVINGLSTTGILPGKLNMPRCAKSLYDEAVEADIHERENLLLMAYAYSASEENAAGHTCVTAPTLGASGIIAAFMHYCLHDRKIDRKTLIDSLAIGGLFGNLIKSNATISGAVGGCQAEVGAAVSMCAASCAYIMGLDDYQIEYAAEVGMEHNLGLTCDPVMGYVMIPCIERNAMGVLRSVESAQLSKHMCKIREHLISFDMVVETMNETGKQIPICLKETSEGGLAKEFDENGRKGYSSFKCGC